MRTLADAWAWYDQNRATLRLMSRLGRLHWPDLPWEGKLGRDDNFPELTAEQVQAMAESVLAELDDLGIFVIFSVFESVVRHAVSRDLQAEVAGLKHPALQRSALKTVQNIEEGSFHTNVLELFKRDGREPSNQPINSLVEEVSRVRRYRNWVAHGRKEIDRPDPMAPKDAYDTLQAFLTHIRR